MSVTKAKAKVTKRLVTKRPQSLFTVHNPDGMFWTACGTKTAAENEKREMERRTQGEEGWHVCEYQLAGVFRAAREEKQTG